MEEVNVVAGQTVLSGGEKPPFFFFIKEGRFKSGSEIFHSGSFVAVIEYLLDGKVRDDVVAEEDGVIVKYSKEDALKDEEFKNVLKYLVESLNATLIGYIEKDVVGEFEKSVDIAKIAELAEKIDNDEEVLSALEEMLSIQKLPELPDDPEKARAVVEMISKEEDILRYVLHRIAFAKMFPDVDGSKDYLLEAIRVYMDELDDRYGALYAIKLSILFYPDDEMMKEVLRRGIKVMRMNRDPEWFEYLIRLLMKFPEEEVRMDEIS